MERSRTGLILPRDSAKGWCRGWQGSCSAHSRLARVDRASGSSRGSTSGEGRHRSADVRPARRGHSDREARRMPVCSLCSALRERNAESSGCSTLGKAPRSQLKRIGRAPSRHRGATACWSQSSSRRGNPDRAQPHGISNAAGPTGDSKAASHRQSTNVVRMRPTTCKVATLRLLARFSKAGHSVRPVT